MEINFLAPGIGVIDDIYIQNEELIEHAEAGQWRDGTAGNGVNPDIRITDVHDLDQNNEIHKELLQTVIDGINLYGERFPQLRVTSGEHLRVMRYTKGGFYALHADGGANNPRNLSIVLFLNDDFEGGELEFPEFDLKLKPKAGQLVLFPSSFVYTHKSNEIIDGTKYCMVSWFR